MCHRVFPQAGLCLGVSVLGFGGPAAMAEESLVLETPNPGCRTVCRIDPQGAKAVNVRVSVPHADIQQVWMPDMRQPLLDRKWWLTLDAAPQSGMPFVSYFNMGERNRFSFGAEALEWDSRLTSKINQEKGTYEVALRVVAGPKGRLKPFAVTLDRRDVTWTQAVADWRASLAYPARAYPEAAWKPVYCTWYAVHAALTEAWVEKTAKTAADLGFRTFVLDDGWSYDEMKRVNPDTIGTWYRDVGRWDAFSTKKFPHFKAHRERMRALGLKYLVWVAPYFLGTRSEAFRRWGYDRHPFTEPFEGNSLTDVANGPMMESVTASLERLLRETDLDGLKIDFLDYVAPSVDVPRGAVSLAYVEDLMKRLRALKPDGLYEFRQPYATPALAHLATQFRADDVPFEWMANFLRLAQLRLTMGDGIPIHADPIYWSAYEDEDNVNRHFMASFGGVPMVSVDFERLPPRQTALVRSWVAYYARHIEPFQRQGRWTAEYRNGGLACLASEWGSRVLLIVAESAAFARRREAVDPQNSVVLNLSYENLALRDGTVVAPACAWPANAVD